MNIQKGLGVGEEWCVGHLQGSLKLDREFCSWRTTKALPRNLASPCQYGSVVEHPAMIQEILVRSPAGGLQDAADQ